MSAGAVVFVDATDATTTEGTAASLLTAAAHAVSGDVVALVTIAGEGPEWIGRLPAGAVLVADVGDRLDELTTPFVDALDAAIGAIAPEVIVGAGSDSAREVLARCSARREAAIAVDVVALERDELGVIARHEAFGGDYVVTSATTSGSLYVSMRIAAAVGAPTGSPRVDSMVVPSSGTAAARVVSTTAAPSGVARPDLSRARSVVAGGRGLGSSEGFLLAEQLADVLGAAVGASRAAIDAGMTTRDRQVGQTGATVSPDLYVALGISGAAQHLAGMRGARTIVAVTLDPAAPILGVADLGVVGDVNRIVPELVHLLRRDDA